MRAYLCSTTLLTPRDHGKTAIRMLVPPNGTRRRRTSAEQLAALPLPQSSGDGGGGAVMFVPRQ